MWLPYRYLKINMYCISFWWTLCESFISFAFMCFIFLGESHIQCRPLYWVCFVTFWTVGFCRRKFSLTHSKLWMVLCPIKNEILNRFKIFNNGQPPKDGFLNLGSETCSAPSFCECLFVSSGQDLFLSLSSPHFFSFNLYYNTYYIISLLGQKRG